MDKWTQIKLQTVFQNTEYFIHPITTNYSVNSHIKQEDDDEDEAADEDDGVDEDEAEERALSD